MNTESEFRKVCGKVFKTLFYNKSLQNKRKLIIRLRARKALETHFTINTIRGKIFIDPFTSPINRLMLWEKFYSSGIKTITLTFVKRDHFKFPKFLIFDRRKWVLDEGCPKTIDKVLFVISLSGGRSKNLIRVLRRLSWSSTLSSFLSLPKAAMILQGQTWLSEISRKRFRKAEVNLACFCYFG